MGAKQSRVTEGKGADSKGERDTKPSTYSKSKKEHKKDTSAVSPDDEDVYLVLKSARTSSFKNKEGGRESGLFIRKEQMENRAATRPYLTDKDRGIIMNTWGYIQQQLESIGTDMFVGLFEKYPDLRGAFAQFKKLQPKDEHYRSVMRAHGLRVLSTVETTLNHMEDHSEVVENLHELGQKHITFNAKPDYLDLVSQQFLFAIEPVLKDKWNPEVEQAWTNLCKLIVHIMKEAMVA